MSCCDTKRELKGLNFSMINPSLCNVPTWCDHVFDSLRQLAITEKSESQIIDHVYLQEWKPLQINRTWLMSFFPPDRAKVLKGIPDAVAIMEGKVWTVRKLGFTNHSNYFLLQMIIGLFWCLSHHALLSRCVWRALLMARQIQRSSGSRVTRRSSTKASLPSLGSTRAAPSQSTTSWWEIQENTASLCATSTARKRWMWPWAFTSVERHLRRTPWRWAKRCPRRMETCVRARIWVRWLQSGVVC